MIRAANLGRQRALAALGLGLGWSWAAFGCSNGGAPSGAGGAAAVGSGGLVAAGGQAAGGAAMAGGAQGVGGSGGAPPGPGGTASGGFFAADGGGDAGTGGAQTSASGGTGPGECLPFVMPTDCTIPEGAVLPSDLRCTGLFAEGNRTELGCGVQEYKPAFELWSDGAGKRRYVWLPPGETIDVSEPDDFRFPVGTKFWKEFQVGPQGSQKLGETRYLEKTELGWLYTSYVWDAEGLAATQTNDGVEDLFGTGHSVPTREQCKTCHVGRKDYVLGWDFILLGPGAEGVTRETLVADERFMDFGAQELSELPKVPGDLVEQAALSYLHVNCGVSCHNENTNATSRPSGLFLRLEQNELTSPQTTDAVTSGVNRTMTPNANVVDLTLPEGGFYEFRPLDLARSLSYARMDFRGTPTAMPALGTHLKDPQGIESVALWIHSMTVERGYPAPGP